ncbi:MAG: hypothetical protein AAF798_16195 [Bacteroidota bacterium]
MSITQLRQQVHQYVDQLDDAFLQIVHSMLDTYAKQQVPLMRIPGVPSTDEEIMDTIEQSEAQIERGEYYSVEELEQKVEQWLSTKS